MSYPHWMIRGPEVSACNCNWGCPCQFNSLPTHGDCRAAMAMRIEEGFFGDEDLSGVIFGSLFAWPGAVHEGNGQVIPLVDDGASEAQRHAVLQIMSGETSEPGATVFNVFASTMTKVHDPIIAPIDFHVDLENWTGKFTVPGYVEAVASPITNPITGKSHRARVVLPEGFEYREAEFVSSRAHSNSDIPLDWSDGHGHIAILHMTPSGPVG
jgi:hypothetical protein